MTQSGCLHWVTCFEGGTSSYSLRSGARIHTWKYRSCFMLTTVCFCFAKTILMSSKMFLRCLQYDNYLVDMRYGYYLNEKKNNALFKTNVLYISAPLSIKQITYKNQSMFIIFINLLVHDATLFLHAHPYCKAQPTTTLC